MAGKIQTIYQEKQASRISIWGAMLTIYIVWGSTYLAIRFAVQSLPPLYMAAVRFIIAGGVLFAFRRLMGDPLPSRTQWRSSIVIGFFLLVMGNGGVSLAEQLVPSALAALIVGTVPLWLIVLDVLVYHNRWPNPGTILGVVVGFAGILLLFWPSGQTGSQGTPVNFVGAGLLILSAICWATGSLYSRSANLPSSPLMGSAMEMLSGGVMLFVAGTLMGEWNHVNIQAFTDKSLYSLGYLIVFGSLVAYVAYTWLLRVAPTSIVSTYAYINPLVAIGLGYQFAGELLTRREFFAAMVIIGAVILTTMSRAPSRPPVKQIVEPEPCGED